MYVYKHMYQLMLNLHTHTCVLLGLVRLTPPTPLVMQTLVWTIVSLSPSLLSLSLALYLSSLSFPSTIFLGHSLSLRMTFVYNQQKIYPKLEEYPMQYQKC